MKEALFYRTLDNGAIDCVLCPNKCCISESESGDCRVRRNINGKLVADNFGKVSSLHFDPIEKKPLYHFYPGRKILSVGSIGCNLHCEFCQNYEISQTTIEEYPWASQYKPEQLVEMASNETDNIGLAYTYNEPAIFYEFMKETACLAKVSDLQNVMVSNGYINQEPLNQLFPFLDAFNIDLKAFNDEFYGKITGGRLESVKSTLKSIKNQGKHLEVTHLVIPRLNDNVNEFRELVHWISNELGNDTVLHISRYFPAHVSSIAAPSVSTLEVFFEIASEVLDYVYLGNVHGDTETYCRICGNSVIHRNGYNTEITGITESGQCIECGEKIIIN